MSRDPEASADAIRDALAWCEALIHNDADARGAIAVNCDPVEMIDALAMMHLSLLSEVYPDAPAVFALFDLIRSRIPQIVGQKP